MQDKQLRITILREIDEHNLRSVNYADFASQHNCTKTGLQIELLNLVNNGFISGQLNETEIINPYITSASSR